MKSTTDELPLINTIGRVVIGILAAVVLLEIPVLVGVLRGVIPTRGFSAAYLVPQALALALPLGVAIGVVTSLGGRSLSRQSTCAVLVIGLLCAAVSAGNFAWLLPKSNRVFRESVQVGFVPLSRNELTPAELRIQRDAAARTGDVDRAKDLDLYYHTRWSLAYASIAFALFAIAVVRRHSVSRLALGVAMCLAVLVYYVCSRAGVAAGATGILSAAVAAWAPNVILALVSTVLAFTPRRVPLGSPAL